MAVVCHHYHVRCGSLLYVLVPMPCTKQAHCSHRKKRPRNECRTSRGATCCLASAIPSLTTGGSGTSILRRSTRLMASNIRGGFPYLLEVLLLLLLCTRHAERLCLHGTCASRIRSYSPHHTCESRSHDLSLTLTLLQSDKTRQPFIVQVSTSTGHPARIANIGQLLLLSVETLGCKESLSALLRTQA